MKQIIIFLLFFSLIGPTFGQLEFSPNVISLESSIGEDVVVRPRITNNTSETLKIYWKLEKGPNFPVGWVMSIWDSVICYTPDKFQSNILLPNEMEPGSSFEFTVNAYTNGVEGAGYVILRLFDDVNFENEVASTNSPTTSVHSKGIKDIVLYPNPSADYIRIKGDETVKSIEVVNSIGRTVFNATHQNNELHPVSHIPNGMYHVILRNVSGEVIKILNFSKV